MGGIVNQPGLADLPRVARRALFGDVVNDTSPQLGGRLDPNGQQIGWAKGADIASASPLVLGTDGNYFDVTGTTNFATITVAAGNLFGLQFDGALTMTHNGTTLDLPGEANITTAAGDFFLFFSTGANQCHCVGYTLASGEAVAGATREFFIYAASESLAFAYVTGAGDFVIAEPSSTQNAAFVFYLPNDFTSLTDAVVVVIPDTTETIQWDVTTDFGASGEAITANSDSITNATLSVTANQIAEADVSAALTGIAAGDYVGMLFESDTTSIGVAGLRIRYS